MKKTVSCFLILVFCLSLLFSGSVSGEAVSSGEEENLGQDLTEAYAAIQESVDTTEGKLVPILSETYPGQTGHLELLKTRQDRAQSYTGPGKAYGSSGGYKPWEQRRVTVYFNQNGWILADITYATEEERFVYFASWSLDQGKNVPAVTELTGYDGFLNETADPVWGPDSRFNSVQYYQAMAQTPIRVFFQENGYVYGEYQSVHGLTRMWFPAEKVSVPGMIVINTGAADEVRQASGYGLPRGTKTAVIEDQEKETVVEFSGEDEWSAWSDTPMTNPEGYEVRYRILYRRKNEIMDWSDWIDGDAPNSGYEVETRVILRDGIYVGQWREFGYHYHYGDWSEWSENYWDNVCSSSDIVESKVQYSYRKLF